MDTSAWFWFQPDKKYKYIKKPITNSPEEWRQVPDMPGVYVSSSGRVKKNGKILKQLTQDGYKTVLRKRVHRLVAMAFLPNPDGLPVVNHIDGNRSNNNVDNLEWMSYKDNTKHACYVLNNHMRAHAVRRIEDGEVFLSASEAAKVMGCNPATISHACLTGEPGMFFHWEYIKK